MREILLDPTGKRKGLRYLTAVIVVFVCASQFFVIWNVKDRFSRSVAAPQTGRGGAEDGGGDNIVRSSRSIAQAQKKSSSKKSSHGGKVINRLFVRTCIAFSCYLEIL